jgi:hypothetical protein
VIAAAAAAARVASLLPIISCTIHLGNDLISG